MCKVILSETEKHKKFELAAMAGYDVREFEGSRRCYIVGADDYIDNNFRGINDVLLLLSSELRRIGFAVVA